MAGKTNSKLVPVIPDSRLTEVFDIVCDNVGPDWKKLAVALGLTKDEIVSISKNSDPTVPAEQCWEALCKWRMKTPRKSLVRDLCFNLVKCRQNRVADLVNKLMGTTDTVDEILSPHTDREDKMLEAMYAIVDIEAAHWRNLAKHLGLTDLDIISIQRNFGDRTREKCMHALYKWRHTVPLHEYKVANLVMVLRACGLKNAAGVIQNLSSESQKCNLRKRYSDEIFIRVDIQELEVENYTPTPSSTPRGEPTPRPKNSLPQEALKNYVLNKIFFHLLDSLECQEKMGTHPLVQYLYELSNSKINEVNRKQAYIAVSYKDSKAQESIFKLVKTGEMSKVITACLITENIKKEIGLENVKLTANLI